MCRSYLDFTSFYYKHWFLFFTALLRCNWHTKPYTYLTYTIWWVCIYTCTRDTITTSKVIDIFITFKSFLVSLCFFFFKLKSNFMVRTINVRSALLTAFKMQNTKLLTIGTILYSRSLGLILHNCNFIPTGNTPHLLFPPFPGNHHSIFCFSKFDYFRYLMYVE